MSRRFWLVLAAALTLLGSSVTGEERLDSVTRRERSDEQIAALIDQLDHSTFASRQAASEQLEAYGIAALAQLETTATAGSREASSRALAIIKQHFRAGSDDVKFEARGALERLAQSDDASASQRARDVLNPPQPVVASNRFGLRPPAPPPPAFPPPLNNIFGGAGGFRRVSISDIGGRRTVEIDERERRLKMETLPGGNIEVEVADKQNPGNPVRKLDAKDLDELRRKDGEIARLYEQHQGLGPNGAVPAGGMPFGVPPPPLLNPADVARLQIQSIESMLGRYRQRLPTDPTAQRMIDSLEQTKARLQAIQR